MGGPWRSGLRAWRLSFSKKPPAVLSWFKRSCSGGPPSPNVLQQSTAFKAPASREEHAEVFGEEDVEAAAESLAKSALSAWRSGERDRALAYWNAAIEYSPPHADWWLNRANLNFEMGRYAEALADYEESLRIAPSLGENVALFFNYHLIKRLGPDSEALKLAAQGSR
jgi:tetratricopeptide (TPR) repeat protein